MQADFWVSSDQNVALKIIKGAASQNNNELRLFSHINDNDSKAESPGQGHVLQLLDSFEHQVVMALQNCSQRTYSSRRLELASGLNFCSSQRRAL